MVGAPRYLNTKQDYMNYLAMEDVSNADKVEALEALLSNIRDWVAIGTVKPGEGIEDQDHKVVEDTDMETGEVRYIQYEMQVNQFAKLFDIGFTEQEVRDLIENYK